MYIFFSSTFSIKPRTGLLHAQHHQIFVLRAQPNETKLYKEILDLKMNHDDKNTEVIIQYHTCKQILTFRSRTTCYCVVARYSSNFGANTFYIITIIPRNVAFFLAINENI